MKLKGASAVLRNEAMKELSARCTSNSLEALTVSENNLDAFTTSQLISALLPSPLVSLKKLDLSSNRISGSCHSLYLAVTSMHELEDLILDRNPLGHAAVVPLEEALATNPSLKE